MWKTLGDSGRELRRSVRGHLRGLGESAGTVAHRLRSEGVRGLPGEPTDCALARYLQAVVGSEMAVGRIVVKERMLCIRRTDGGMPILLRLPRAAARFVRAFDGGCYPDLVDPAAELRRGAYLP